MPRKRSSGPPRIGDLSPADVDVLLVGESQDDPFAEFFWTSRQRREAWRTYGDALRAEARRRGIVLVEDRRP